MAQNPAHCLIRTPIIGIFSNKTKYRIIHPLAEGTRNFGDNGGLRSFSVSDVEQHGKPGDTKSCFNVQQMFSTLDGKIAIKEPTFFVTKSGMLMEQTGQFA